MRQPQTRNWSPEIALNTSTARLARAMPAGPPNWGQEAMKPRLALVCAHSIDIRTEPPHSPPTPTPWMNRRTIMMSAAQMPIWS
jgi:hypothetical protein